MDVVVMSSKKVEQKGRSDMIRIIDGKIDVYWPDDGIVSTYDASMYDVFINEDEMESTKEE